MINAKTIILILALLAWGWLNQQWEVSLLLLSLIVMSLLTPWRWEINRQQFHRIGDLASLLIILVLIYGAFAELDQKLVFIVLKSLPLFFAPILLAQLFSGQGIIPLSTLFYSLRKRQSETEFDIRIPFAGCCLLSSGASTHQGWIYFSLAVFIIVLILWSIRSRFDSVIIWLLVISFSIGSAFWTQKGLHELHTIIETEALSWLSEWHTDPFKNSTSLGEIGQLKLSDKIEFRVKATEPLLLLQSTYDRYLAQSWYASKRTFKTITFNENPAKKQNKQLIFYQQFKRKSILALPSGTIQIEGLEGATMQSTELGTIRLTEAPDFVNYQVTYTGDQLGEAREFDLTLPARHQSWIQLIKNDLNLENQSAQVISKSIKDYFKRNYYYTLFLGKETDSDKALQEFILNRKAGHCEYFAIASVFLLRSYGIPARLANGYSMQEYDESEQLYIVRRRHAHAWAIAHIDGKWQALDATPSQWFSIEEDSSSSLRFIYDGWSRLKFIYKQWRYQQALLDDNETDKSLWISIAILLSFYITWRLYSARKQLIKQQKLSEPLINDYDFLGMDSELFLIEQALSQTEQARLTNESIDKWGKRLANEELQQIIKIHYAYRFDPRGISALQREKLKRNVQEWLKKTILE